MDWEEVPGETPETVLMFPNPQTVAIATISYAFRITLYEEIILRGFGNFETKSSKSMRARLAGNPMQLRQPYAGQTLRARGDS